MTPLSFVAPSPPSSFLPSSLHPPRLSPHTALPSRHPKRPRPPPHTPPCSLHTPANGSPPPTNIRPDLQPPYYPTFLPQTIEHALQRAQASTAAHLQALDDHPLPAPTLRVELPMGRSRRFWYRMSPPTMAVAESATLALHFAQLFRGLRLALVVAAPTDKLQPVDWAHTLALDHAAAGDPSLHHAEVVLIAGANAKRRPDVQTVLARCEAARAVVLFNCFMDLPLADGLPEATDVYICRALDKCAVMREDAGAPWAVFVEIAVFEYEWVGERWERKEEDGDEGEPWIPTQSNVEAYAASRGASRKMGKGFWSTAFSGCEAGFWPFMTIAAEQVLPIDGRVLEEREKEKAEKRGRKGGKRPFGFF